MPNKTGSCGMCWRLDDVELGECEEFHEPHCRECCEVCGTAAGWKPTAETKGTN